VKPKVGRAEIGSKRNRSGHREHPSVRHGES
jgi:hypothetical protein